MKNKGKGKRIGNIGQGKEESYKLADCGNKWALSISTLMTTKEQLKEANDKIAEIYMPKLFERSVECDKLQEQLQQKDAEIKQLQNDNKQLRRNFNQFAELQSKYDKFKDEVKKAIRKYVTPTCEISNKDYSNLKKELGLSGEKK